MDPASQAYQDIPIIVDQFGRTVLTVGGAPDEFGALQRMDGDNDGLATTSTQVPLGDEKPALGEVLLKKPAPATKATRTTSKTASGSGKGKQVEIPKAKGKGKGKMVSAVDDDSLEQIDLDLLGGLSDGDDDDDGNDNVGDNSGKNGGDSQFRLRPIDKSTRANGSASASNAPRPLNKGLAARGTSKLQVTLARRTSLITQCTRWRILGCTPPRSRSSIATFSIPTDSPFTSSPK